MPSIRRRLTVWYTVALGLTVSALAASLYVERRGSAFRELDARLDLEAQFAERWLASSKRVLGHLTTRGEQGIPALDPNVAAYFENVRDVLLLADPHGQLLFTSEQARALAFEGVDRLAARLRPLPVAAGDRGIIDLGGDAGPLRFLARPVAGSEGEVAALIVATPLSNMVFGPGALLQSILVAAPLLLLCALGLGYLIAGRALGPVQRLVDEVEAISDGRSLHRRLAVTERNDEIGRLAATLNGMLARLERSFDTLRRFTADASHELKTPLMVLRAGVERALTDPRMAPELLGALDESLEQINRMTEMVESLLTLARADEGGAPLTLVPLDLCELLAEAAETAEMLGEQAGVGVSTEMPADAVPVQGDRGRLRQLLMNLVTNAIKYTAAGGTVSLSLEKREHGVLLAVRDTGIGITPADQVHIFDRFWRADVARSRTGDRAGTGLGLAICKWIAEAHGGTITVASRPGKGSVFTVTLPHASSPADRVSASATPAAAGA